MKKIKCIICGKQIKKPKKKFCSPKCKKMNKNIQMTNLYHVRKEQWEKLSKDEQLDAMLNFTEEYMKEENHEH